MKAFNEFAAEAAKMENQGQVKEAATAWRWAAKVCKKKSIGTGALPASSSVSHALHGRLRSDHDLHIP